MPAAAVPPPPPPPFLFASNTPGGGSLTAASSAGAFPSTIGDVYTYAPAGGSSIESAAGVGPQTTALTTSNGAHLHQSLWFFYQGTARTILSVVYVNTSHVITQYLHAGSTLMPRFWVLQASKNLFSSGWS